MAPVAAVEATAIDIKAADSAARNSLMFRLSGYACSIWGHTCHFAENAIGIGEAFQALSSTSVSGRSEPAAVSVCHLPSAVSYSIISVRPGVRCSLAARLAAAT